MMRKLFTLLFIALALFAAIVASRPSAFSITRSSVISAPPASVFAKVNDLHQWEAWSPWARLDPAAVNTFEGSDAGTGAIMRWSGNHKVGVGSMTIVESRPDQLIRIKLHFEKPFKADNDVTFSFAPRNNETVVAWNMSGNNNFIGKAMSLMMNCEKMVGEQFEKGLTQLKAVTEGK